MKLKNIFLVLVIFYGAGAMAQDNYNFYFQKAPGPTTVIQGAPAPQQGLVNKVDNISVTEPVQAKSPIKEEPVTSKAASETSSAAAGAVSTKVNAIPDRIEAKSNWSFAVGGGQFVDSSLKRNGVYRGGYLGVGYGFGRYFGINGSVYFGSLMQDGEDKSKDGLYRGNIGLSISPLQFNFFGAEFVELKLLAGAMQTEIVTDQKNSTEGQDAAYSWEHQTVVKPYAGVGVTIPFGSSVYLDSHYKRIFGDDKNNNYQAGIALGIRL